MAENAGRIEYHFIGNTQELLKSEDVAIDSTNRVTKALDKQDKAVDKNRKNQRELSKEIDKTTASTQKNKNMVNEFNATQKKQADYTQKNATGLNQITQGIRTYALGVHGADKAVEMMVNELVELERQARKTAPPLNEIPNSIPRNNPTSRGIKNIGDEAKKSSFNASNFSYQIQDIAVQAQMGTSWLVIFAQQFPQMAVGMGAAATAIGATVAILGALGTAMIDTETDAQKLEKTINNIKAVMTVGAGGVIEYTQQMQELGRVSEIVANRRIRLAMMDASKAVKLAVDEMASKLSEVDDTILTAQLGFFAKSGTITRQYAVQIGNLLGEQGNYLDRTGDKADEVGRKFISLFQELRRAKTPTAVTDIQEQLIEMVGASDKADKKFVEMFDSLMKSSEGSTDFFTKLREATATLEAGSKATNDYSNTASQARSSVADMTLELITQKIALEDGERAALQFKLQMDGLTEAQKKQVLALYDANKATEASIEASRESSKALEDEIDAYIKIGDEAVKAAEKEEAAAKRKQERLGQRGTTVGLTEVQNIEMRYESDLEALKAAREQQLITNQEYDMREIELNRQKQEAIRQSQSETNQFMQDAFGNLDTQIAGTMAQVVVGAKDGKEAMRSLANAMLTQVVGAAVQYGIELVKNRVLGQALATSEQANIAATTATGIASQQAATASTVASAGATATAAAPAAALTSTFSFGSAAVIGGIALLGTLAIAKMMGGRQYGGPVSSGMYRVNETGAPEVYSYGGKDYLMNTKNANIKPLEQGGGGGMTVNISNNTPYEVFVTQDQAAQIANVQIGKEAGKAAKGQGQMLRGMQKGTNLQRNARS